VDNYFKEHSDIHFSGLVVRWIMVTPEIDEIVEKRA